MRDIKFRAWNAVSDRMYEVLILADDYIEAKCSTQPMLMEHVELMQYTGLKDKNGVDYVYEGDIVTEEGLVRGNVHEIQPRDSDIVIPRITSKDWQATYKIAMDRGLIHA